LPRGDIGVVDNFVFTLRCTQRLLTRLKPSLSASPPASTTRLGDWYGNVVYVGRLQLVLAISDSTLLPVVISAAPMSTLVPRLRAGVGAVLGKLEVAEADIADELAAMETVAYAKTADRRVTGVLVEFARMLPFYFEDGGSSLLEAALWLARTPCSPLYPREGSPDRATAAAFAARVKLAE
jgi:hypothetical protein